MNGTPTDCRCPECERGVIVVADRPEGLTGHTYQWCSDNCGWSS